LSRGSLPLAGAIALLGLLLRAAGSLLAIGQPLTMSMVVQAVPEGTRGTALAIRLTGNRFGQVATPAAAGRVAGAARAWRGGGCGPPLGAAGGAAPCGSPGRR